MHHSLGSTNVCCELKYWQKIDQKWNAIYWLKTVYDDYIIKWPIKQRIVLSAVLSINKLWQKIVTEMVQQGDCPHRMSRELAWCVSFAINSNSNYKLTQKITELLWLNLFYFSAFLLGFQKLGEQASISSSFRQLLFVFLFQRISAKRESEGFLLQPLFSFFWQFSWDIIQTKNLNVLTFWQSCQNKTFNENTKLPKTRLLLVGALWLVETFYSHVKKPFRFSDWFY